jgi:cyclopropane fatty-acyl-phospholipid synthase-like methyltransferase
MANSTKNLISQIQQTDENNRVNTYDIGTKFSNVRLDENTTYSLKDFYDAFMTGAQFTYTGSVQPTSNNVKVWYDTSN